MHTALGPLPSKIDGLHSRVVGDEVIVIDESTQTAHVLQGPAAALWLTIDRGEWPDGAREAVRQAARELEEAGLVRAAGLTRRRMLVHGGAAVAAGTVLSMSLPSVAAADSVPPSVSTDTKVVVDNAQPTSGASVTFTVTVSAPGATGKPRGTVSLTRSGQSGSVDKTLENGSVTFAAVAGPAGTAETFTATYVPEEGSGFVSSIGTVEIVPQSAPAPQPTIDIAYPPNPPAGQTITVTVTVTGTSTLGAPTGRVVLRSGTTSLGASQLSGTSTNASSTTFDVAFTTNPRELEATYEPGTGAKYSTVSKTGSIAYSAVAPVAPSIVFVPPATGHLNRGLKYVMQVEVTGPSGLPVPSGTFAVGISEGSKISSGSSVNIAGGKRYSYTVDNTSGNPPKTVTLTGTYTAGTGGNYKTDSKIFEYNTTA